MNTPSNPTPNSITSGLKLVTHVLLGTRGFFALPILLVCLVAEFIVQWATFTYEQQSAPPNVAKFPLLGISLFGMIILMIEVFKIPMAIWGATINGWRRAFCNVGILIVCLLTWATIKDIGYNDSNAALASSRAKHDAAQVLQAELDILDKRLLALKSHKDTASGTIQNEIDQRNAVLDRLDREADDEIKNHERQRSQVLTDAIDPGTRQQIESLERDRDARLARYQTDIDRLDETIRFSEQRNIEIRQGGSNAHLEQVRAWTELCLQMDASHAQALEQALRDYNAAQPLFKTQTDAYEIRRKEYEGQRSAVEAEFEIKKREHEKNDTPFYGKDARIAADRKQADQELARLASDFEQVEKPIAPLKANPVQPPKPQRPTQGSSAEGLLDIEAIQDQRTQILEERGEFENAQSSMIATRRNEASLSLPRFRGHPNWRGCSPGVLHGQATQDRQAAAAPDIYSGVQS